MKLWFKKQEQQKERRLVVETMQEVEREVYPRMVIPSDFLSLTMRSRLPAFTWYQALYLLQQQPTISVNKLAGKLHTSWPAADVLRQKVAHALEVTNQA